jgi:colicin import membrane protein
MPHLTAALAARTLLAPEGTEPTSGGAAAPGQAAEGQQPAEQPRRVAPNTPGRTLPAPRPPKPAAAAAGAGQQASTAKAQPAAAPKPGEGQPKPGADGKPEGQPAAAPKVRRADAILEKERLARELAQTLEKHKELEGKLKPASDAATRLAELEKLLKENPLGAAAKYGHKYQDLLKAELAKSPDADAKAEVERLRAELAEKDQKREQTAKEQAQQAERQQEVAFVGQAMKQQAEKFPLVARFADPGKVHDLIYKAHQKGVRLPSAEAYVEHALQTMEEYYEGQIDSVKDLEKVKKRWGGAPAAAAPGAGAAAGGEDKPTKKKPALVATPGTLTARHSSAPPAGERRRPPSVQDRLREIKKKHLGEEG